MIDGQHLDLSEARQQRVLTKRGCPHDAACSGGRLLAHADQEAVENAESVQVPVQVFHLRGEALAGALVDHQYGAVALHQTAHGPQRGNRVRHIVDALKSGDQIVALLGGDRGRVHDLDANPLPPSTILDISSRELDGRFIQIETVEGNPRIASGDGNGG